LTTKNHITADDKTKKQNKKVNNFK